MNTTTMSAIIVATAGAVILLLIGVIKVLVSDHLKGIRKTLETLQEGQDEHSGQLQDHAIRLTKVETTMRLVGCQGPDGISRCAP